MVKKILLGFHDENSLQTLLMYSRVFKYSPDTAATREEILKLARENQYERVAVDINLGNEGAVDTTSLEQVKEIMSERLKSGLTKLVGLSGNEDTVKLALSKGLPAENKAFFKYSAFFGESK